MMVALCMWDILVGLAQIQQRELKNTRVLCFPLPRADTGGLLFENGSRSMLCLFEVFFAIKVSLLTYSSHSV